MKLYYAEKQQLISVLNSFYSNPECISSNPGSNKSNPEGKKSVFGAFLSNPRAFLRLSGSQKSIPERAYTNLECISSKNGRF
ncbi:MAG: hypothetical protein WCQ95_04945 [Bacteroidota bacterium]